MDKCPLRYFSNLVFFIIFSILCKLQFSKILKKKNEKKNHKNIYILYILVLCAYDLCYQRTHKIRSKTLKIIIFIKYYLELLISQL